MTREEKEIAINQLQDAKDGYKEYLTDDVLDMAVKALEQEPILDKIATKIMQLDYDLESVDYDYNDMPQIEVVHMICREEVLRIIDEYKAERSAGNDKSI